MNTRQIQRGLEGSFVVLGAGLAYRLAQLPHLAAFKLLNVAGILYDLLGVLILTYVVVSSNAFRSFIAGWGSVLALGLTSWTVLGLFGGALVLSIFGSTNLAELWALATPMLVFALASGIFIEDFALVPIFPKFKSVDARVAALGGYFLVAGLLLQFYAAILDLGS